MAMQLVKIGQYEAALFTPEGGYDTLLYTVEVNAEAAKRMWEGFHEPRFAMVAALGMDWFGDLTPWPEPTVYSYGPDFGGRADALVEYFRSELVPQAEAVLGAPAHRGIFGFSLGGLFATYAFYKTDLFSLVGGICASLWYDGFADWMCSRRPAAESGYLYFCLGELEHLTKFERMSVTGECMKRAVAALTAQGYSAEFELVPGDHLDHIAERTQLTVDRLLAHAN